MDRHNVHDPRTSEQKGDHNFSVNLETKQECIPVGYVPPAAVAVCWGRGRGCLPQCMLGYTPLGMGLKTPPWCGPGDPPSQTLNLPPGCGPGDPPPVRPLNLPSGCGPGDLQGMLGYPPVWAWRPPSGQTPQLPPMCGPGDPPARPLNFPPGCGPGDPPSQTPQLPPRVWAWRPARHAGINPPPPPTPWTE